jgi:tetratricopeptide (TPR) repeat protein
LWPGLPQVWLRGEWAGLAKAISVAVIANAVLLGCFGWGELINSGTRNTLLAAMSVFWIVATVAGYVQIQRSAARKPHTPAKDTFAQALDLYLKGDYFQAECLLVEILGRQERDADARLLLATLYRHNKRYDEAMRQLDVLGRFEDAEKWATEIERERMLIEEGKKATAEEEFLPAIEPRSRMSEAA